MDPEIVEQLNEQLRLTSELIGQQNSMMADQLRIMQDLGNAEKNFSGSIKNAATAVNNNVTGTTKLNQANAEADIQLKKSRDLLKEAFGTASIAVKSFGVALTSALTNTEEGFKKYGSAIEGVGDAAWNIGKNFGILGGILGGSVKGLTMFAGQALAMHDNMIQMNRDLTKFTGVLPITNGAMADLASNAGYSSDRMLKLSKITESIGSNIIALGDTAGQGAIKFTKMAAVGDDVYEAYSRMGIAQEDLTNMQAMYIKQQAQSGRSYDLQTKTASQLQKESLAYVDNLIRMSAITGENADELERNREVIRSEFEERVKVRQEELEAQRLDKLGRHEEAEAIRNESKARQAILQRLVDEQGKEVASMYGRVLRTGGFDSLSAGLAAQGQSAAELVSIMKNATTDAEREAAARQVSQGYLVGLDNTIVTLGDSMQWAGESLGKSFAVTNEALGKNEKSIGKSIDQREADAKKDIEVKKTQQDKDAQLREEQETADRKFQREFQDAMLGLARTIMPVITAATEAAATALEYMNDWIDKASVWLEYFKDKLIEAWKWLDKTITRLGGLDTVLKVLAGATGIGLVIKLFGGLGSTVRGLTSVFGGLKNAFSEAINWLKGLLGFGGGAASGPGAATAAGRGGKLLRFAKGAAGGLGGLLGGLLLDYGAERAEEAGYTKTAAGLGIGSAAATGAGLGALLGPAGALAGGLIGGGIGLYQNWGGLTGSQETEKTTKKVVESAEKNDKAAKTNKEISNTQTENTKKQKVSTDSFNDSVASFGKIVYNDGKIVESFGKIMVTFIESVKRFGEHVLTFSGGQGATGGSTVERILSTIKQRESGNNYQAQAKGSSASGAYQFIDSTWQSLTNKYKIGMEYKRAVDAPAAIQDQVAGAYVQDILQQAGGDVSKVPLVWYTGNIQGKMSQAAIAANKGLTAETYQRKWMEDYNKTAPVSITMSGGIVGLGKMLQSQGLVISGHSAFNPGGKPTTSGHSRNSRHYRDMAIDINAPGGIVEAEDPVWGPKFDMIADQLRRSGYNVIWRGPGHDNHIHASVGGPEGVKAARGGIFNGSSSGYPATLHGTELVAPLQIDSVLMKLAKTPADAISEGTLGTKYDTASSIDRIVSTHSEMISMISRKLDDVIDVLDRGNNTRDKIYKHARV